MEKPAPRPPKYFHRFFRWYCHPRLRDFIEGDLMEVYERRRATLGKRIADRKFRIDVMLLLRPGIIRPTEGHQSVNTYGMFKSYMKTGWRNLLKQKMYSAIKIGGFAAGIGACLLMALYVRLELSYDLNYPDGNRIYRVLRVSKGDNGIPSRGIYFPASFAEKIQSDYPEIVKAGRYGAVEWMGAGSNEVKRIDQTESLHEDRVVYMDQPLLDILSPTFIYGSPKRALADANSMVINKTTYEKYFNHEDPLGKIFMFNNNDKRLYKVTGVVEDVPSTSHLQFDILVSLQGREFYEGEAANWENMNYPTYIVLRPGANPFALGQKLSTTIPKYFLPAAMKSGDARAIEWTKELKFELQPINQIYLNRDGVSDDLNHGDMRYIWLFGSIAAFILIIACINFINLSTAKSANRAKEVGLRKVVGSARSGLIHQFLTESMLFSFFSFVAGIVLALASLPAFNNLLGKTLVVPWTAGWLFPGLLAVVVIIGIVAGLYPALYLSSFAPAQVLKGKIRTRTGGSTLRSSLVIFQFFISVVLISGTLIINRQMNFIFNKKLGFDKDHVLVIQGTNTLENNITAFKTELLKMPEIKRATVSAFLPVALTARNGGGMWREGRKEVDDPVSGQRWSVDEDYLPTMGLKIVEGRDFLPAPGADKGNIIINESMRDEMHLADPIGRVITNGYQQWAVIGVVENFHYETMKERIAPLALMLGESRNSVIVKTGENVPAALAEVEQVWKKFSPNQSFRYMFLDQSYAKMYEDVRRTGTMLSCFTVLAIVVACLGLFALSTYMAEQRAKEISVRRVLGATHRSIVRLLSVDFVKLVIVAILIAIPVSWYMIDQWLRDFVYKIEVTWDVFAISGLAAVLIALITVGFQSVKAALANPVKNLKTE